MDLRKLLYDTILSTQEVIDHVGVDFVFQRSAFTEPPKTDEDTIKRFIVYHASASLPTTPSKLRGKQPIFWIWCHDQPGDYNMIDLVLEGVSRKLEALQPPAEFPGFLEFRWLETSIDLDDPEMFTICRYCRIQATTVQREDMAWDS